MSIQFNNFSEIVQRQTTRPHLTLLDLADADHVASAYELRWYLLRMAPTADRTITLPSAEDVVNAMPKINPGNGVEFLVQNDGAANSVQLVIGTGGTFAGTTLTDAGEIRRYFLRVDDAGYNKWAYTVYGLGGGAAAQPTFTGACGQIEVAPPNPPQGLTQGGTAGTDSTLGDADTWLALVAGQGSAVPTMRTSNPNVNWAMERWDSGTTTHQGDTIYGLRLSSGLADPKEYHGIYRYDITLVFFMDSWNANDRGHLYRVMLARNGTPVTDPTGTPVNDTVYGDSVVRPYEEPQATFPLNGPYTLAASGHTYINADADWFVPFMQNFSDGNAVANLNPIQVYSCVLSMNRVAPLPTRQTTLNLLP